MHTELSLQLLESDGIRHYILESVGKS